MHMPAYCIAGPHKVAVHQVEAERYTRGNLFASLSATAGMHHMCCMNHGEVGSSCQHQPACPANSGLTIP